MKLTLKAARVNAGYTQAEAAKLIGINKKTLSFWETGKTTPRIKQIPAIEKAYKISYDDLVFLPR